MEPLAGAFAAAENLFTGAFALAKGFTNPITTLKATLSRISTDPLPRASHTISVIKGRAYVFGGETRKGALADNAMLIIVLPSSGVLDADFFNVPARPRAKGGPVPRSRKGHSAVVVGNNILVYGGEVKGDEEEKPGTVWRFDTAVNVWDCWEPSAQTGSQVPALRYGHAAAGTDEPGPPEDIGRLKRRTTSIVGGLIEVGDLPQQPPDPASVVPEPPSSDSFGTMFIAGGRKIEEGDNEDDDDEEEEEDDDELLGDAWAFNVGSRTWHPLPSPPGPARELGSLAVVGTRLFGFGGQDESGAPLGKAVGWVDCRSVLASAAAVGKPQNLPGWEEAKLEEGKGPHPRSGAALIPVTTNQGRDYLILLGGVGASGDFLDDIWTFQPPPATATAAAARTTHEGEWKEVEYQYLDQEGDVHKKNIYAPGLKGTGQRARFAAAKGTEVDGASVVLWGGVGLGGNILRDGWLVTVDR